MNYVDFDSFYSVLVNTRPFLRNPFELLRNFRYDGGRSRTGVHGPVPLIHKRIFTRRFNAFDPDLEFYARSIGDLIDGVRLASELATRSSRTSLRQFVGRLLWGG